MIQSIDLNTIKYVNIFIFRYALWHSYLFGTTGIFLVVVDFFIPGSLKF
jgi:hypothetical protein